MNWATIIPVLVGSVIALASSVSVEYLRDQQTTKTAIRERKNAVLQQSREELHTLVMQVQDSLEQMIRLADKIRNDELGSDDRAGLGTQFHDVTLSIVRLVSRLPDEAWRSSVNEVIKLANKAIVNPDEADEDVDSVWNRATKQYEEVMERVAEPLQKFYSLALNGNSHR